MIYTSLDVIYTCTVIWILVHIGSLRGWGAQIKKKKCIKKKVHKKKKTYNGTDIWNIIGTLVGILLLLFRYSLLFSSSVWNFFMNGECNRQNALNVIYYDNQTF